MNQFILQHFVIMMPGEKETQWAFQLSLQPGTPWEILEKAFEEYKAKFLEMKTEAIKADEERKAAAPTADNQ